MAEFAALVNDLLETLVGHKPETYWVHNFGQFSATCLERKRERKMLALWMKMVGGLGDRWGSIHGPPG